MPATPSRFEMPEWANHRRRAAQTPEGAEKCARRDYMTEGAVLFPESGRPSQLILDMLDRRHALAAETGDPNWLWDYKTSSYTEAELRNIVVALKKIENKRGRELRLEEANKN